jgi:CxxC-x17-CxxC domain-containing protein
MLQDRELRCASCGEPFTWTAGEQSFFADKHLPNEPRHCHACQARRHVGPPATRPTLVTSEATCSQCGRPTTVPFKPLAGRPVFCRTCYRHRKSSSRR